MSQRPVTQPSSEEKESESGSVRPSSDARGLRRILAEAYPVGDCTFGSLAESAPAEPGTPAARAAKP